MLTIQFKDTIETFQLPFTGRRFSLRAVNVEWIAANEEELERIRAMFGSTIPDTGLLNIMRWHGDIAKTIVANL